MTPKTERPFGLTLLAALSVGFGIYNLAMVAQLALALRMKLDPSTTPGFDPGVVVGLMALPLWFVEMALATSVLKAALLIATGWALFTAKKLGRVTGTAYGVLSIAETVLTVVALPYGISGGTIISVLFPIFMLLAVNTMFKPQLTQ